MTPDAVGPATALPINCRPRFSIARAALFFVHPLRRRPCLRLLRFLRNFTIFEFK